MDGERATAVFRVFQEILTNVVCHAKATEAKAALLEEDGGLVLKNHFIRLNGTEALFY